MMRFPKASMVQFLLLVLGLLGPIASSIASSIEILDQNKDQFKVDEVAKVVCANKQNDVSKQLSRYDSILSLRDYFKSLPIEDHLLSDCKRKYSDSLDSLSELITVRNDNVCSDEKLSLIEDFHNLYVSTAYEQENDRKKAQREAAPQVLRLFFILYAMEIGMICKSNVIHNLEWDVPGEFPDIKEFKLDQRQVAEAATSGTDGSQMRFLFNGAADKILGSYNVNNFDDVVMFWPLIEQSYLSQTTEQLQDIRDEFDPELGEPLRLMVKLRAAKSMSEFRRTCHYKYKPIYEKLIIPIVRLSNLGYSNNGEKFERDLRELKENFSLQRWYAIAQICDATLPIRFYEDLSLRPDELIMISKEEAHRFDEAAANSANTQTANELNNQTVIEYEPKTNSLENQETLKSVFSSKYQDLAKQLKVNLDSKVIMTKRAIARIFRSVINSLRTNAKKIFLSKFNWFKNGNKQTSDISASKGAPEMLTTNNTIKVDNEFSKDLASLNDEDLMSMSGACRRLGQKQAAAGERGVARRKIRRRKGDVDLIQEMRAREVSYSHTKSWDEILSQWSDAFAAVAPSRTQIVIFGGIVIGLLLLVLVVSIMASAAMVG